MSKASRRELVAGAGATAAGARLAESAPDGAVRSGERAAREIADRR